MLIVDINALSAINLLNFGDNVFLNCLLAFNSEDILRIGRTGSQFLSFFDMVTLFNFKTGTVRNKNLAFFFRFGIGNRRIYGVLYLAECYRSGVLGKNSHNFRMTYFEKLLNSGKTLCDVSASARDTAGVERSHRQLCTGLTDRLCGDNTDRLTDIDGFACRKVFTVASCANTVLAAASENGSYLNSRYTCSGNSLSVVFIYRLFAIFGDDYLACLRINNVINGESAEQSCLKRLDFLVTLTDFGNPNACRCTAVIISDNNVLRNIDKSSCQVTGVCRTESRIGLSFTGTS